MSHCVGDFAMWWKMNLFNYHLLPDVELMQWHWNLQLTHLILRWNLQLTRIVLSWESHPF